MVTVWLNPAAAAAPVPPDYSVFTTTSDQVHYVLQDVIRLYKFALVLQLLVLVPYLIRARYYHESARNVIHKVLDTLVSSAPPPVPAIMLLCGFAAIVRLRKHGITLLYPEVLKLGASCQVVAFDKTGTLTGTTVCNAQMPHALYAYDQAQCRVLNPKP